MHLLVDGHHLAYRLHHTPVAKLSRSDGSRSGIIYGFIRNLSYARRVMGSEQWDTTVVFDGGRSAVRTTIWPQYKQGRIKPRTPDEQAEIDALYRQVTVLEAALPLFGIRVLRIPGCEADDLIALFARLHLEIPERVAIYSSDKDFHQLAEPGMFFFQQAGKTAKDQREIRPWTAILDTWGVDDPRLILLGRAIWGDESDTIPGIHGIGESRAKKMLQWFAAGCPKPPDALQRWVDLYWENAEIVLRNLLLMRLPHTLVDSYLTIQQGEELFRQVKRNRVVVQDTAACVEFCREWEFATTEML